ncbi:hypothetical protein K438DRAFT_1780148 [Mycena galopus ATCC 62051]|nr:hypothetical protein K438DRAFT_1780148 [Mycena galopus ATCC 62051]
MDKSRPLQKGLSLEELHCGSSVAASFGAGSARPKSGGSAITTSQISLGLLRIMRAPVTKPRAVIGIYVVTWAQVLGTDGKERESTYTNENIRDPNPHRCGNSPPGAGIHLYWCRNSPPGAGIHLYSGNECLEDDDDDFFGSAPVLDASPPPQSEPLPPSPSLPSTSSLSRGSFSSPSPGQSASTSHRDQDRPRTSITKSGRNIQGLVSPRKGLYRGTILWQSFQKAL